MKAGEIYNKAKETIKQEIIDTIKEINRVLGEDFSAIIDIEENDKVYVSVCVDNSYLDVEDNIYEKRQVRGVYADEVGNVYCGCYIEPFDGDVEEINIETLTLEEFVYIANALENILNEL